MPQPAEPAAAVAQFDCPTCAVPAGSTCRKRGGKVAPKYHTPRFVLVPRVRRCFAGISHGVVAQRHFSKVVSLEVVGQRFCPSESAVGD
ncbi:zinc finger domain-containing protein [Streptomyces sp. NPDC001020]